MSMCCYVFSRDRILNTPDWQRHIDHFGFELELTPNVDVQNWSGHLSARWKGREGGFECSPDDVADMLSVYGEFDFRGPWHHVLSFYYSEIPSCAGAIIAAAVYAKATDGILFEPQEGIVYTADDAIAYARRNEAEVEDLLRRISEAGGLDAFAQTLKPASKRQ